jgi:16S rRNA (uracil1498-N3)-methyltransferase
MRSTRIYYPHSLQVEQIVSLTDQAANHLRNVLRAEINDTCILFNGDGCEYQATISALNKKVVHVKIIKATECPRQSPLAIHLGQAISRGEKMDWVIQKSTELGVREITPLITERCNVRLDVERWEKKRQHWQAVAISACEQSGRTDIVTVHAPQLLNTWLQTSFTGTRLMLEPSAVLDFGKITKATNIQLLIGSEGGFTDNELQCATTIGFIGVQLGPRILRSETAPIVAMSILQHLFGDL